MNEDYEKAWMEGEGPVQDAVEKAKRKAEELAKATPTDREEYARAYQEGEKK